MKKILAALIATAFSFGVMAQTPPAGIPTTPEAAPASKAVKKHTKAHAHKAKHGAKAKKAAA